MIKIAPSILSADFSKLGNEVERLEAQGADWVHVDIMDGLFVPNLTIGPGVVSAIRPFTQLPFDVHLMIVEPERYLDVFAQSGADIITIHVEASTDVRGSIEKIHSLGKRAGLSLNPETPFEAVEPYLDSIDLLLVMTVHPGFGGQSFMESCVPKISQARKFMDDQGNSTELEVDGGINYETARKAIRAGATVLAAGSSLFKSGDMRTEMERWRQLSCQKDD